MTQLDLDLRKFINAGLLQPIDPHTGLFALHSQGNSIMLWVDGNAISWHGEDGDKPASEIAEETVWMISEEFQRAISQ